MRSLLTFNGQATTNFTLKHTKSKRKRINSQTYCDINGIKHELGYKKTIRINPTIK